MKERSYLSAIPICLQNDLYFMVEYSSKPTKKIFMSSSWKAIRDVNWSTVFASERENGTSQRYSSLENNSPRYSRSADKCYNCYNQKPTSRHKVPNCECVEISNGKLLEKRCQVGFRDNHRILIVHMRTIARKSDRSKIGQELLARS